MPIICALAKAGAGRKVSDEFTVPLCRGHHREVHGCGDEVAWWRKSGIDPTVAARALWLETHPLSSGPGSGLADVEILHPPARERGQRQRPMDGKAAVGQTARQSQSRKRVPMQIEVNRHDKTLSP